jgi:hypothetical protein
MVEARRVEARMASIKVYNQELGYGRNLGMGFTSAVEGLQDWTRHCLSSFGSSLSARNKSAALFQAGEFPKSSGGGAGG